MLSGQRLVNYSFFNFIIFLIFIYLYKSKFILNPAIYTAAVAMLSGAESSNYSRKPDIMGDAVYALICKDSKSITGQFLIDEEILKNEGITDFTDYACNPGILSGI